ncbi:MAG TPA: CheR family methyltransferase [Caulobacteraceae bacterium]
MTQAGEPHFPIVAVGASAGGIEALEAFFRGLPDASGCAFVVLMHLSPGRRSLLPEIIARHTAMPVEVAEDGAEVRPNHVYVLPANAILGIGQGRLQVRQTSGVRRERKPIDFFFAALAKDLGERAAGVVLSGGDGDGTLGVKALKEHDGLTLAQTANGDGPQHPDMPDSAIASGLIDIAVPAHEMGRRIVEYFTTLEKFDRADADGQLESEKSRKGAVAAIFAILRNQIGHDFSGYKERTFQRRVHRRMQVNRIATLQAYVERLRQDPNEVAALFRDLLINVTTFFRDAEAFKVLEGEVIPKLFEGRGAEDAVRVWVPGCATGEEVFSIAILLQEHLQGLTAKPRVQVFATDIDERALAVARAGRYPEALMDAVSRERRERFFTYDDGAYALTKEVRDICIFSPHSLIRDPPFSQLDLISCRNLLIYLGPKVQSEVIPIFHYALRPGGYLFLGTSENVSQHGDLFVPLDKKQRVFRARETGASGARLPLALRSARPFPTSLRTGGRGLGATPLRLAVEGLVLDRYAPAHVVVNREGDVVYYSARTGKYLEAAPGAPTRQLSTLARKGLRLDIRATLREAVEADRRAERAGIVVDGDDGNVQRVDLVVEPMADSPPDERLYLVVFDDDGPTVSREKAAHPRGQTDDYVAQMERELGETRERLQSLVEEYETSLEELKSSNEELVSVNEELQSTNEELEASKEELQSLNEELHTVNLELNGKIDDLDRANADLSNLFESTRVATVFLDRELVIRSFTPAASDIFSILPGDRGRPLTDLASQVSLPALGEDVRAVFAGGETLERTLEHRLTGRHYLLRVVPYRDGDARIQGVVLTFVDVTGLTLAEAHLKVMIAELNHRVKNMLMVVVGIIEQTFKASTSAAFKDNLVGRVSSLARSYELIAHDNWTATDVKDLVSHQTAAFGEQVLAEGPTLRLSPRQALALGMILHELATNAGKYGALSLPTGRVELRWDTQDSDAGPEVRFTWREQDGPKLNGKVKKGFGMRLIEGEAIASLSGACDFRFDAQGLNLSLTFRPEAAAADA